MSTAQTTPGTSVTAASATGGRARAAATLRASSRTTLRPWTCSSQTGGVGRNAPTARRLRATAAGSSPPVRGEVERIAWRDARAARGASSRTRRPPAAPASRARSSPAPRRRNAATAAGRRRASRVAAPPLAARHGGVHERPRRAAGAARRSAKSGGSGDSHSQATSFDRMDEPQPRACSAWRGKGDRLPSAVRRIADQRMAERRQVDADLVRASGLEATGEQRRDAEALEHVVVRARGLAGRDDRHRRALRRMAADRRVDGAAAREVADRERHVLAPDGARLQLAHEVRLRLQRLRDDQEAARVLVEAMDDAGARERGELRARGAAARSAACRPSCRCPDARPGRPACRRRAARRPRGRSRARSARVRRRSSRGSGGGADDDVFAAPDPARRRPPARRRRVTRPASIQARSRLREYCGSACASAASKRWPAAVAGKHQPMRRGRGARVAGASADSAGRDGAGMLRRIGGWRRL